MFVYPDFNHQLQMHGTIQLLFAIVLHGYYIQYKYCQICKWIRYQMHARDPAIPVFFNYFFTRGVIIIEKNVIIVHGFFTVK